MENTTADCCSLTKYEYGNRFEDNVCHFYVIAISSYVLLQDPFEQMSVVFIVYGEQ